MEGYLLVLLLGFLGAGTIIGLDRWARSRGPAHQAGPVAGHEARGAGQTGPNQTGPVRVEPQPASTLITPALYLVGAVGVVALFGWAVVAHTALASDGLIVLGLVAGAVLLGWAHLRRADQPVVRSSGASERLHGGIEEAAEDTGVLVDVAEGGVEREH